MRHDGYQCGYCTPGQVMSATGMLEEAKAGWPSFVTEELDGEVALTREEVAERMSGNLCRCSAYPGIVEAIRDAANLDDPSFADPDQRGGRRMRPFDYTRADATGSATAAAARANAAIIAGGTNLLDLMKLEVMAPDTVVDITRDSTSRASCRPTRAAYGSARS